ncbi:MAG TPA: NERD domain-containing protein [Candidatus Spyradenecus faecavium]|uniref:NERD domain-containing protein n=1 Tax=Candidatus Spyradenecus faecavium TaxID=2840947 RepID=A0A9D1NNX4_9BACT|nr:NERD domain-containing protein [Candidatus Spyradenecus faecavium]
MPRSRATMKGVPGDAARRRGLRRVLVPVACFGVVFGFGVGLAVGGVGALPWWVGVAVLALAFAGFLAYCRRQPTLVYGYFKGARGEEMVAGELAHLPASWTILNGVLLPDGRDVDHVAVGPQGIFVIETKHWSGEVSVAGAQILANGRPLERSPVEQVRRAVNAVARAAEVRPDALHGVLCFAGPQFADAPTHADEVFVCSYLDLVSAISLGPAVLDAAAVARCVARLGALTLTEGL